MSYNLAYTAAEAAAAAAVATIVVSPTATNVTAAAATAIVVVVVTPPRFYPQIADWPGSYSSGRAVHLPPAVLRLFVRSVISEKSQAKTKRPAVPRGRARLFLLPLIYDVIVRNARVYTRDRGSRTHSRGLHRGNNYGGKGIMQVFPRRGDGTMMLRHYTRAEQSVDTRISRFPHTVRRPPLSDRIIQLLLPRAVTLVDILLLRVQQLRITFGVI